MATGMANLVKLLVIIASPLSREAMALSSLLRSWAALSMIAWRSGFISVPKMIFVFMFARIWRGMREGSWVIATIPRLNFRPSLAMVLNMFGPCSRTSLPRTRGASSKTITATGFSSRAPLALWRLYDANRAEANMLPMSISCAPLKLLVSMTTMDPSSIRERTSRMVVVPEWKLKGLAEVVGVLFL